MIIKFIISETSYNSLSSTQINQINSIGDFVIGSIPNIEKYSGGSVRCMIAEIF
ncbi:MAG: arginine deiminase-related protein [Flavobacteriaceae bacterium]